MGLEVRTKIAGGFLVTAGVFAGLSEAADNAWLKYLCFGLGILAILGAFLLMRRELGRLKGILFPICKNRLETAWSICVRCAGFYLGTACSVILVVLAQHNPDVIAWTAMINPWVLIVSAIAMQTPTALHGVKRRLTQNNLQDHATYRMVTGFLSGLGWFVMYLGIRNIGL